jgi:hypothetical protein
MTSHLEKFNLSPVAQDFVNKHFINNDIAFACEYFYDDYFNKNKNEHYLFIIIKKINTDTNNINYHYYNYNYNYNYNYCESNEKHEKFVLESDFITYEYREIRVPNDLNDIKDCLKSNVSIINIEKEKYKKMGVIEEIRHNCNALYIPINLKDDVDNIMEVFNGNMYKFIK